MNEYTVIFVNENKRIEQHSFSSEESAKMFAENILRNNPQASIAIQDGAYPRTLARKNVDSLIDKGF